MHSLLSSAINAHANPAHGANASGGFLPPNSSLISCDQSLRIGIYTWTQPVEAKRQVEMHVSLPPEIGL